MGWARTPDALVRTTPDRGVTTERTTRARPRLRESRRPTPPASEPSAGRDRDDGPRSPSGASSRSSSASPRSCRERAHGRLPHTVSHMRLCLKRAAGSGGIRPYERPCSTGDTRRVGGGSDRSGATGPRKGAGEIPRHGRCIPPISGRYDRRWRTDDPDGNEELWVAGATVSPCALPRSPS